ncbi:MAG: hypothetical protein ACR2F2_00200, partial [Pyrinomonadaceae bacterium]
LNFENSAVLSLKATNLIASGETRRLAGKTVPTLKVSNKCPQCLSLSGTRDLKTCHVGFHPTLLNMSLSATFSEI